MLIVLVRTRARRRQQGIEQHVDIAHRLALVLTDKVEGVVGRACHIRKVGLGKLLPVSFDHAEGIEQQHAAAQLPAPPRGDAPKLAARVNGDGRSLEPPVVGRQQVKRDGGALADAGRRHGDGRTFQGPADQLGVAAGAPLAEQDALAFGETAHEALAEQARAAVEIGFGTLAAAVGMEVFQAADQNFGQQHERHHEPRQRHGDQRHPKAVQSPEVVQ